MNHLKNFLIASFCSFPFGLTAEETGILITIISTIILPIVFFVAGKALDVGLQVYLHETRGRRR